MLNALHTQVLVVGSGAAGITAAIAAAEAGANVTLIERHGFLGGLSTGMPWFGFHDRDYRQIIKGLPAKFVQRLQQLKAASEVCYDPKCASAISVDGHAWKCVAMEMVNESGVQLMLHTSVIDTLREGDRITGVTVSHKSGQQTIHADVVIDCSGDGDVAAMGDVAWEKGRKEDGLVQSPSIVVRMGGMDRQKFIEGVRDKSLAYREWLVPYPDLWDKMMARLDKLPVIVCGGFASLVAQAREAGTFTIPQTRVVGVKTHYHDEFVAVMTRVLGLDPIDPQSLTAAYSRIYPQVLEMVQFFRDYIPGCSAMHLREIMPMLGIRESRRVVGEYMLTIEDLVDGRMFDDTVALGGYHMDIHRPSGTWVESQNVRMYGIPMRSLIAKDVDGLMMAGKCVSATHEAVASTRVIAICMAQGEAAGTAAAMAAQRGVSVRDLDTGEIRQALMDRGVEIGETLGPPNWKVIEEVGQLPLDEEPTTDDASITQEGSGAWLDSETRLDTKHTLDQVNLPNSDGVRQ